MAPIRLSFSRGFGFRVYINAGNHFAYVYNRHTGWMAWILALRGKTWQGF